MRIADLQHCLSTLGARTVHEQHLLRRWAQALQLDGGKHAAGDFLPRQLRAAMPALVAELQGTGPIQQP